MTVWWYWMQCWRNAIPIATQVSKKIFKRNWSKTSSRRGCKQLKLRTLNFCQLEDWDTAARIQNFHCLILLCRMEFKFYKACFHLSGYINSQNSRIWNAWKCRSFFKYSVWCAVSWQQTVVSLFLEETFKAENDQYLLTQLIAVQEENVWDSWFQQDRVTTHTAKKNKGFLAGSVQWSPCWVWCWATTIPRPHATWFLFGGTSSRKNLQQ